MTDALEAKWQELMRPLGVDQEDAFQVYKKIVSYYGQSKRHYHNLAHVGFVLDRIDEVAHLAENLTAVKLAAWFHDVVYNTQSKKNEERSAELACRYLQRLGVEDELIEQVAELILATKQHLPENVDQQVLLDADLATFGVSSEQHAGYSQAIRKEFWWVPEAVYKQRRVEILNSFVKRERLYSTDIMFDRYEENARHNISMEIKALAS
ncbi:MAG: hypothetical protein DWQ07_22610 [Chloroflexi bacterium]|nr:MAG: hypothetical protein DWQ07_22610 [Chloroflexota bacterium]MBL1193941.1 hypothetical protein [Chloroflexota bacterium]NOH11235.1 hypothetical protein [Chloroflexota bacterium]